MSTGLHSNSRIGLRMRPDLVVRRHVSGAQLAWVVKDPVSLRYFTFTAQEFSILRQLDGAKSLEDVRREFENAYPPYRLTPLRLQHYLAKLSESGLLIVNGPNQGQLLLESGARQVRDERWQTWLNWLAIRFRGIDPERALSWAYPRLRWCFSRPFLALCLCSMIFALALIIAHAGEFRRQLPGLQELVGFDNLFWLVAAFAAAKVFHEIGHALTCKHYGGECHEMGVMLLLFAPTLYCNVTDSWMLQNRWQRIVVSAAGVLVEMQLAALAVICWWFSQPGLVHTIALNLVLVCSVGTLFFNGNPLLRYDGYFVLADLIGIPNLWQESRLALKNQLSKWFFKAEFAAANSSTARPAVLATYAALSVAYRLFVTFAILVLLYRMFVPRGIGILVPIIALSCLAGGGLVWFRATHKFWSNPAALRRFDPRRMLLTGGAAAVCLFVFFAVGFPCKISAPALLQPLAAQRVYVSTPGTLKKCVSSGESVIRGQVLARLEDAELQRSVRELVGELRLAQTRVRKLKARLADEPGVAAQLEVAQEMLADVRQQLSQRKRDEQGLTLTAPIDGVVMEPPQIPGQPTNKQQLPAWSGTPLDKKNAECFLARGTLFCLVGEPRNQEAVLFVDESDVQYVRVGHSVRMQFPVATTAVLTGRVEEIAKRNILTVPHDLADDQELTGRANANGVQQSLRAAYSIRVALDPHQEHLRTGANGRAKIAVDPQSLAQRLLRVIRATFTVQP